MTPTIVARLLTLIFFISASVPLSAQAPDLTNGGVPNIRYKTNLGPTGLEGWMYQASENVSDTSEARQILVTAVDPGSPADGILAVDDVILGVGGTGATPTNFTSDPRPVLAQAINDAEARSPATLSFLRWRAGVTDVVDITLQTLGAYAPTAPYNCPKSALILENALEFAMQRHADGGFEQIGALSLLAGNDPSNPKNAARQARAASYALNVMPTPEEISSWMNGEIPIGTTKNTWRFGYRLIVLSEYYLSTSDTTVLPGIEALANVVGNGASILGAYSHGFMIDPLPEYPGEWGVRGYGAVNSAGLLCTLGMSLAKSCGISTPGMEKALERGALFYGSYVNRGGIPYGEAHPTLSNTSNGKSAKAALFFNILPGHEEEAKYFSRLALFSKSGDRDAGHSTPFFSRQFDPLAIALTGEEESAKHFKEIHWLLDLSRNWEGGFDWTSLYNNGGDNGNNTMAWEPSGGSFYATDYALLTYALPLKQITLTGNGADPAIFITPAESAQIDFVRNYDPASRTKEELVADLNTPLPVFRNRVATEIGLRTADHAYFTPILTSIASDPTLDSCEGAIVALGKIKDPSTIPLLVSLLTYPDPDIGYYAGENLRNFNRADLLPFTNAFMDAAIALNRPFFPLDPEDPMMDVVGQIASLLFADASGEPYGILQSTLEGVDRERLYQVIEVMAELPRGVDRRYLRSIFPRLAESDMEFVGRPIMDAIQNRTPADGMWAHSAQINGLDFLERLGYAEVAPVAKDLTEFYRVSKVGYLKDIVPVFSDLGAGSLAVEPDANIVEFLKDLVFEDVYASDAQAALDVIAADTNPRVLTPLKKIHSIVADSPILTLPSDRTALRVDAYNHAADSIYNWRKVHGPGQVTLAPLNNPDDGSRTVIFDGVPGTYLFELTISDDRQLTTVTETVSVRLEMAGGGLPTNNPPTATPQSFTFDQGKASAIQLSGTDPEGYELSYKIVSDPLHGTLSGIAPLVVYKSKPGYTGPDSFDFEVMDSEGQTSTATISLTVTNSSPVGLALYEPFNYGANTPLNGQSGSGDVGFATPWNASPSAVVRSGPLMLNTEETFSIGGHISDSQSIGIAERNIAPSALAGNGLLDDGATLWFSLQIGIDAGENVTNSFFALALANNRMGSGYLGSWIEDDGAVAGSGIGLTMRQDSGRIRASQFVDASFGTGVGAGSIDGGTSGPSFSAGESALILGKIVWGATPADNDRIELYWPRIPHLIPDEPTSVLEMQVDQSTFDTLSFRTNAKVAVDEIRFGQNLSSVLSGTIAMTEDLTAPDPNPPAFDQAPTVDGIDSIRMSAVPVFDLNGVEYYFTCTSGGGNDSGWQSSPDYTDTGLTSGVTYGYTVTTRDLSPAGNVSTPSAVASASIPSDWVLPDLVGISPASAQYLVAEAGIVVGSINYANHPDIPAGAIVELSETAGTVLTVGSTVNLIVSLGPVPFEVPYLGDLTRTQAEAAIATAGLTVGNISFDYSAEAADSVIAQSPAPETPVAPDSTVDLVLSNGLTTPGTVIITDTFTFSGDLALDPAYSSNPGSDGGFSDFYGIDKPLTLSTTGFTAAGADKLVGVISMHNSVAAISEVTSITYGGVDVTAHIIAGTPTGSAGFTGRSFIFSIDNPTADGDLVLNFGAQYNVDEVGVALFALNNTQPGYLAAAETGGNPAAIDVIEGDFVLGHSQRNNQSMSIANAPPYTEINLSAGNLASAVGYLLAPADGPTAPVFTNTSGVTRIAAFETLPLTSMVTMPDLSGLTQTAAESSITASDLVLAGVTSEFSLTVPAGEVIRQYPAAGEGVNVDTSVYLVISLGASPTVVPDVVGLSQVDAESAIAAADLTRGTVTTAYSSTYAFGNVISQSIAAGTTVNSGNVVNLVISKGIDPNADMTPPSLAPSNIVDDQGGASVLENDLVTYTLTFSEDMDAGTVDTADFSNGGSSAVTIGTISKTAPGVFEVQVTPISAGTLQIQVSAGASLTDLEGNSLDTSSAITDDTIITVVELNDAPVANDSSVSTGEDTATSVTLSASDTNSGDTLTYAVVSGPANGSLSGTAPNLTYTPSADFSGTDSFTFTANDGTVDSNLATVTITVTPINDAPVFTADPIAGSDATENSAYSGSIAGSATDVDGDTLTYAAVSGPAWLSVATDGTLSGTPAGTDIGANSFTVSVSDGTATPVQAVLDINVLADLPAGTPAVTSTAIWSDGDDGGLVTGGTIGFTVANTDSILIATLYVDGTTAGFTSVRFGDGGGIGTGDFAPDATFSDGRITSFLFLNPPTGAGNSLRFSKSTTGGVAAILYEVSGAQLSLANITSVVASNTIATTTANELIVSFAGRNNTSVPTENSPLFVGEDLTSNGMALRGGGSLSSASAVAPTIGSQDIAWNNGSEGLIAHAFKGAPVAGDTTAPTLGTADIVDDQGGAAVIEGTTVTYTLSFSEDMDEATVGASDFANAGSSAITVGTITETTPGVFSIAVTPTTAGTLQLAVAAGATLTDVAGNALDTTTAIMDDTTITVDELNVAPVASDTSVTTAEDSATSITLAASDANAGDTLTYTLASGPVSGVLSGTAPNLTYTPSADFSGTDSFTFTANDGTVDSNLATVTITVTPANDAPVFTWDPIVGAAAAEDSLYSSTIAGIATDVDGDTLTYALISGPAWLSVGTDGSLSGTPVNSDVGINSFTVSVSDGTAPSVQAALEINVLNTNDAPVASDDSVTVDEDSSVAITLTATDIDAGDTLSYAIVGGPANGSLSGTAPNLTYTPSADFSGTDSFTFVANDGTVDSNLATVTITVTPTNDAPTASDDAVTVDEDGSVAVTVTASDIDTVDTLTYSVVSGPASGALSGTAPNLTYTPSADFSGTDSFTFVANDGTVDSNLATVSITVTPINDAPVFTADPIAGSDATENSAYSGTIAGSATDAEGDALTYALVSGPAWLSVATDGTLSGTPGNTDVGANSFTVSVSDGTATPVQAVLDINVLADLPADTPAVTSTAIWSDGDDGGTVTSGTIGFTVANTDSILIATLYVDGSTAGFTSVRFGDGGGVGTGDVAPDTTITDGRITSFLFLNPPTGAGNSLRFSKSTTGGVAAILYEVSGAQLSLANITSVVASNTIATTTANELIVSFAGRNNTSVPTENSSLFVGEDLTSSGMALRGGGGLSSASAVAPTIDSQDIAWNNGTEGLIAHAFKGASVAGDTTAPTLGSADIVDDQGGAAVIEGTTVTYTLNFSEDMDEATVDASDFANAGNSAITIGTITETTPGVFSIAVTPNSAGTLQLAVAAGATLTDVAGNTLDTTTAIMDDTTITVDPSTTTTPDVTGLTQTAAASSITSASLVVGTVSSAYSATVPAGDVISQSPTGGSVVSLGSAVDLVVSDGPEPISVPDVLGLTEATAGSTLTGAGLSLGSVTYEFSETVPVDQVISQNPAPGSTAYAGDTVDLIVSLGPDTSPKLITGTVTAVTNTAWLTVDVSAYSYNSMVVVATPIYTNNTDPSVVTRINNITATSFDLKLDRADTLTDPVSLDVSIIVVEEGVYTQAEHGVTMEAVSYLSTQTARSGSWPRESRVYQNTYTNPVVVGQVMSYNDLNWSAFWSSGNLGDDPASASTLYVGKMIGEDNVNITRTNETVGYIVIEQGTGTINGVAYEAALGADSVRGLQNSSTPYTYTLSGSLPSASAAAASISGMDGGDGAWAVLGGLPTTAAIGVYACEDQIKDNDRGHTTTQVAYIVFE